MKYHQVVILRASRKPDRDDQRIAQGMTPRRKALGDGEITGRENKSVMALGGQEFRLPCNRRVNRGQWVFRSMENKEDIHLRRPIVMG